MKATGSEYWQHKVPKFVIYTLWVCLSYIKWKCSSLEILFPVSCRYEIGSSCSYSFFNKLFPMNLEECGRNKNAGSFGSYLLSECKPLFYQYSGFQECLWLPAVFHKACGRRSLVHFSLVYCSSISDKTQDRSVQSISYIEMNIACWITSTLCKWVQDNSSNLFVGKYQPHFAGHRSSQWMECML